MQNFQFYKYFILLSQFWEVNTIIIPILCITNTDLKIPGRTHPIDCAETGPVLQLNCCLQSSEHSIDPQNLKNF